MNSFSVNASYTKKENTSELKPTINNHVTINQTPTPALPEIPITRSRSIGNFDEPKQKIIEKKETVSQTYETLDLDTSSPFERKLLSVLLAVISSQDKTLITNVIDQTGDLILAMDDLKELLKIVTSSENITITTEPLILSGCGCTVIFSKKLPIWSKITSIVVDEEDFHIAFNKYYHKMRTYKIALDKVIE